MQFMSHLVKIKINVIAIIVIASIFHIPIVGIVLL